MKIICIGRNYRKHAEELGREIPDEPVVFMKPDSALLKKNKPFFLPDFSTDVQYETEIVVKISKLGKGIEKKFAHRYFDEITLGVDITARDIQNKKVSKGQPWELAKGFDGSAPVGEFIPVSDAGDIDNIDFRLEINGNIVQKGNSSEMIFSVSTLIEYISKFFTLKTGDLIFTGTPAGVGKLSKGDNLAGYLGDKKVFDFFIR